MSADVDIRAGLAVAPWAIGDPGRAAEVRPGRPVLPADHGDVVVSWATVGATHTQAASVRGLMHRSSGKPRQDAFALATRPAADGAEHLIAVVCDGVGSLSRSHEAADMVSRRIAEAGAAGAAWPDAFAHANDELRAIAIHDDVKVMATTAVAAALQHEDGRWVGELAWVGDSMCWHLDDAGTWTELSATAGEDDDGVYHSTRVRPLPSSDGACQSTSFRVTGGAIFLMTDGVGNPLRWIPEVQETLATWWRAPGDPLAFAGQVGFSRKSHNDDRTVIAIWHQSTDKDPPHEDPTDSAGHAD